MLAGVCVASNATQCSALPVPCLSCTFPSAAASDSPEALEDALLVNCSFATRVEVACEVKADIPCAVRPSEALTLKAAVLSAIAPALCHRSRP